MPEVKKNAISFKSSNGTDIVAGYYYTIWDTAPQAAARTEQTAILPKRMDANLCCRICTK